MPLPKSPDFLLCVTCGTQYPTTDPTKLKTCHICDDPRQFVPPEGQSFTTLSALRAGPYKNVWTQDKYDPRIISIQTEPQFAIGQRAFLLKTKSGNVLWDIIAFLDEETISKIKALGGLKAIVISHPHYYTTHLEWSRAFSCPVYMSYEDKQWISLDSLPGAERRFLNLPAEEILEGVNAIKTGGHFDGTLVLHWENKLFIADTIVTVPSGLYHVDRLPGTISYVFLWSIPNKIPLPPDELLNIWRAIEPWEFDETHGAFEGFDVYSDEGDWDVKGRVLESMKIQTRHAGHEEHALMSEEWHVKK